MLSDVIETYVIPIALRLLAAALIWLVGRWLAKRSRGWITKSLHGTALTESLINLIQTVSYYGILVLTALVALGALGVPVATLTTGLGIIVVVLAIALQQSLGNLASTVLILLFKPFRVGEVIETGGMVGVVDEIQMLSTVLNSPDGKTHIVPNGKIQGGGLTNFSTTGILRLNLPFRISYDSDITKAKEVLTDLVAADDRVLDEPPTRVFVQKLADSGMELVAWPFARAEDYALLQAELMERGKAELDAAGIVTPYPQQDVHVFAHGEGERGGV